MKASYLGELMIQNRVKIRPAEIKDAEQIAILCEQLGYFATQQQIQQRLSQIQYNQAHVIYVATLENDYVTGWAHAHVCDMIVGPTQAILFGLVVDILLRSTKLTLPNLHILLVGNIRLVLTI